MGVIVPGGVLEWGVITIFCLVTALAMALVSDRRTLPVDTAIGLALVASMAVGAILVDASRGIAISMGNPVSGRSWESILFGSILVAGPVEIIGGWVVCIIVVGTAWLLRRPMIFWALDEDSARAFGVPGSAMKLVLLALLAMAVVTAMKLVGVVLATALLVLPGATALRLSDRLGPSIAIAIGTSVLALIMGLFASLEFDWQTGPSIVLTMVVLLGVCEAVARLRGGKATKNIPADAA
jgi:zinc transport system permease protein